MNQKRRLIVVQDAFAEQHPYGGAELSLKALTDSSPFPFAQIRSCEVTAEHVTGHRDAYWIFGNTIELNPYLFPLITRTLDYSIIEFDRKACYMRSTHFHRYRTGQPCTCTQTEWGRLWSLFFARARTIWWMSERQRDWMLEGLPITRMTKNIVLSSIFDPATLERLRELRALYGSRKENHWLIIGSDSWIKNPRAAEEYCAERGWEHKTVWKVPYEELLTMLARAKGYIFLPRGEDTCPRVVIEAKLLGCELVLNENVEHKDEAWFTTNDLSAVERYLSLAPARFWVTTANDIAQAAQEADSETLASAN